MAFNFYGVVGIEGLGLLKVISSLVHCKCGNISENVQDRDVVTGHQQELIMQIPSGPL